MTLMLNCSNVAMLHRATLPALIMAGSQVGAGGGTVAEAGSQATARLCCRHPAQGQGLLKEELRGRRGRRKKDLKIFHLMFVCLRVGGFLFS